MTAVRPERGQGQPAGSGGAAQSPPSWAGGPQPGYGSGYPPAEQYGTGYRQPAPAQPGPAGAEPPTAPMHPAYPGEPETARTAHLPAVTDDPPAPAAGRAARRRAGRLTAEAAPQAAAADTPVTAAAPGGRAARRQAAKRGARRARTAAPLPTAGDQTQTPMSRVEARRAARAAKDSPAVVISRVVGEVFISLGVLMLLFVTYQLWYSNILADETAGSAEQRLQQQWAAGSGSDARNPGAFSPGQGFAIIYIPKLDVKAPIAEGVDEETILNKGMVGHYSGDMETAMPWDKAGNFALAGHRNTHGEPFRYINKLVPGDKVIVETASTYYTYQVTNTLQQTSPSNVAVIDPIPAGSGFTKPGRYITLTTCTPEFTSLYRLIVWGQMVAEQPRTAGPPAALTQG